MEPSYADESNTVWVNAIIVPAPQDEVFYVDKDCYKKPVITESDDEWVISLNVVDYPNETDGYDLGDIDYVDEHRDLIN